MLLSYKAELFIVTFVAFGLIVAIDLNSAPGSEFLNYRNLQDNDIEDIGGFFIIGSFFCIAFSFFFDLLRIILLRKFKPVRFLYNRILLLILSLLITGSLILFIYKFEDIEMSTATENKVMVLIGAVQMLFLSFYFIQFFKESKALYLRKVLENKSLIDELHAE